MEALRAPLELLSDHLYLSVFIASLLEAAGIPCPGRIILVVAGTLAVSGAEISTIIVFAATGALVGDHALYLAGRTQGPRLLTLYCRLTLSSSECFDNAVRYFRRFGASAVAIGRFSTSVRLFAAVLAGCGHMTYLRYVLYDVMGTAAYATLWATLGYAFGEAVAGVLGRMGAARALVLVIPAIVIGVVTYRLWRRWRHAAVPTPLLVSRDPGSPERPQPVA